MLFAPWLMVLAILFVILLILFMALVIWLAHALEGYPTLLIRKEDRGTVITPHSLRIRPMPENAPAQGMFAESAGMRARTMHDETTGHRSGRF
jgi:membrane glycosyltransferase